MFERYDEPARRSLFFARHEASVLGSRTIDTEHLLLGLLKDRNPLITHLLQRSNVAPDAIRERIYERFSTGAPPLDVSVEIPFSAAAKQVLGYTAEEAERLLHHHIGLEHLLLGLLRLEDSHVWEILKESGLTLTSVRESLVMHVSATPSPPSGPIYMLSAIDGPSPGRRAAGESRGSGHVTVFSTAGFNTHSIGPVSMSGIPLSAFVLLLEQFLARPVLDDTRITGACDITLHGQYDTVETLTIALREQLGLELTSSVW